MADIRFKQVNEYIFAPFNTFVYLNIHESLFLDYSHMKEEFLLELNKNYTKLSNDEFYIEWECEECIDFKISKGVFTPPGTENSFVTVILFTLLADD